MAAHSDIIFPCNARIPVYNSAETKSKQSIKQYLKKNHSKSRLLQIISGETKAQRASVRVIRGEGRVYWRNAEVLHKEMMQRRRLRVVSRN